MNKSEVPSTYELKTVLVLAEEEQHDVGALGIIIAFLNAALDDEVDPVYLVRPPLALVRLGLISPRVYWKLERVLYGLRSGPKRWGEERDKELRKAQIELNGELLTCHQSEASKSLWLVRCKGHIVARFLVYVDDVIVTGPTEVVVRILDLFKNLWECKISGILHRGQNQDWGDGVERVEQLNFLGITLEKQRTISS